MFTCVFSYKPCCQYEWYHHFQDGSDSNELAGLAKGGQQFKRLKVLFITTVFLVSTTVHIDVHEDKTGVGKVCNSYPLLLQANYQKAINLLVELASLQTSFITLDEVIKTTNRRCCAISINCKEIFKN